MSKNIKWDRVSSKKRVKAGFWVIVCILTAFPFANASLHAASLDGWQIGVNQKSNQSSQHQFVASKTLSAPKPREISLHEDSVLLLTVLKHLAKKAQVGISYQKEIIPTQRITVHLNDVSVYQALDQILKGTGLKVVLPFSRDVLVIKRKPAERTIQKETITGSVTDAKTGKPLIGVNILVVGTSTGTATDVDGHYSLSVSSLQDTLRFSYIGYQSRTVPINGRTTINVTMQSAVAGLNQLVVTALGRKSTTRSLGYSTAQIGSKSLEKSQQTAVLGSLEGKMSGVQISSSSGVPGSSSRIIIRGNSSLTGNNQPLIVVDGVPMSNAGGGGSVFTGVGPSRLSDIDPSIIKSITVLKSAAATALYGQRAANGVILITTRGGSYNTPLTVKLSSSVGVGIPIITGFQHKYLQGSHGKYANGEPLSKGGYIAPGYPGTDPQTLNNRGPKVGDVSQKVLDALGVNKIKTYNPREQFYKNSLKLSNSISFSGGTDNVNYQFSAVHSKANSVVPGGHFIRTNIHTKIQDKFTDRLTVGSSATYSISRDKRYPTGDGFYDFIVNLELTPISYNLQNSKYKDGTQRFYAGNQGNNPYWLLKNYGAHGNTHHFIGNANAQYDITDWLNIKEKVGIDTYNHNSKLFWNKGVVARSQGQIQQHKSNHTEINSNLSVNLKKNITENIVLTALVGNNFDSRVRQGIGFTANGLSVPGFYDVSNATSVNADFNTVKHRLVSVYGQAKFGYNNYAFITFTGRNDWSSTLPKNNNSYFYPSVSASLIFSDLFNLTSSVLSLGKIRATYAKSGSDAPAYEIYTNYHRGGNSDGDRGVIDYPFNGVNAYEISGSLGNLNLKPEITTAYSFGTKLQFLNNRVGLNVTYYHQNAVNQILTISLPASTGYSGKLENAASITNRGWEVSFNLTPIRTQNFSWDINLNYTRNRTIVNSLPPGLNHISLGGFSPVFIAAREGKRGYGIIRALYYEENDKGQVLVNDKGYPIYKGNLADVGKVTPKYSANLNTTFHYKNLSIGAIFDTRQGNDILNFNYFRTVKFGTSIITADRGTSFVYPGVNVNTGKPNTVPIVKDQDYYVNTFRPPYGNYVEDGSYIKLRQLSISYSLPDKLLSGTPIKGLTLSTVGRNLVIWSSFSRGDPEGNILGNSNAQGFYYQQVPSSHSYNFDVSISF